MIDIEAIDVTFIPTFFLQSTSNRTTTKIVTVGRSDDFEQLGVSWEAHNFCVKIVSGHLFLFSFQIKYIFQAHFSTLGHINATGANKCQSKRDNGY